MNAFIGQDGSRVVNQLLIKLLQSPVYYITVQLIAEKNKEVCYLTSELFIF